MRKIIFIVVLVCFLKGVYFAPPLSAQDTEDNVLLQVPVRIYQNQPNSTTPTYVNQLQSTQFNLHINNQACPITSITQKKEAINASLTSQMPRFFTLSFETTNANPAFIQAVIQFIHQYITPTDSLAIRTPVDLYTLDTTNDTHNLEHIRTILENDLLQQQRDKNDTIEKLNQLLEGISRRSGKKELGIRTAILFAANFLETWQYYYQHYLLANLDAYSTFAARFAADKGEKYLLHFQERAVIPLIQNFQNIATTLRTFAHSITKKNPRESQLLLETLAKIERAMLFNRDFPMDDLLDNLLGVNLHCFVFFLENPTPLTSSNSLSSGYETILSTIAHQTGGTTTIVNDDSSLPSLLQQAAQHTDYYYELVFPFNNEIVDQNLVISLSPTLTDSQLYYKKKFRKEEFAWLKNRLNDQLLAISQINLTGHQLSFVISGFPANAANTSQATPVKAEVQLLDSTTAVVFQSSKVLQIGTTSQTISLLLPPQYHGYFKLHITIQETNSTPLTTASQYIEIKTE